MFGELFPVSFWSLALAHGLALLSPGPDFMLIVSHGARHRLRGSAGICLGIAAGNALYIGLAIAGWAGLGGNGPLYRILEGAGALYLVWLGIRLMKSSRTPPPPPAGHDGERLPLPVQFGIGVGSAVLNPKNMVFYLAIMTVLIENNARLHQRLAAGAWMCLAVLVWDLFVAAALSHPAAQRSLWRKVPFIEKACGLFLLAMAATLAIAVACGF